MQPAEITKLFVDELRQEIGLHDTTSASTEGRFALRDLDLPSCYLVIVSMLHTTQRPTTHLWLYGGLRPHAKMRGRCRSFIVSRWAIISEVLTELKLSTRFHAMTAVDPTQTRAKRTLKTPFWSFGGPRWNGMSGNGLNWSRVYP